MDYHMDAETPDHRVNGNEMELVQTVFRRAWERNWPLIILYAIISLGGIGFSYKTTQWSSVALSSAVALATLIIGLFMAWQVITITKTIR